MIDWTHTDISMNFILEHVKPHVRAIELRKYVESDSEKSMFLKVDAETIADIEALSKSTTGLAQGISCIVHEARPLQ